MPEAWGRCSQGEFDVVQDVKRPHRENETGLHAASESVQMATEMVVQDFGVGIGMAFQAVMHDLAEFCVR